MSRLPVAWLMTAALLVLPAAAGAQEAQERPIQQEAESTPPPPPSPPPQAVPRSETPRAHRPDRSDRVERAEPGERSHAAERAVPRDAGARRDDSGRAERAPRQRDADGAGSGEVRRREREAPAPAAQETGSGGGSTEGSSAVVPRWPSRRGERRPTEATEGSDREERGGRRAIPRASRPREGRPVTGRAVPRPPSSPDDRAGSAYGWSRPTVYRNYYYYYPRRYHPYGYGAFGLGYFYYDPYTWWPEYSYRYRDHFYDRGHFYEGYTGRYGYAHGQLRLRVTPRHAEVYVDGYYAGIVDDFDGVFQSLTLEEGPYRVELVAPGFEPLEIDVRIAPGQKLTYRGELRRRP